MMKVPEALIETLEANGYKHIRGENFTKDGDFYYVSVEWSEGLSAFVWSVKKNWLLGGIKTRRMVEAAE